MLRHAAGMVVALTLAGGVSGQERGAAGEAHRHYLLGTAAETRRDLDAAARAYSEAIRLDPRMAVAHDRLGFVYGLQGRTADAIAEFERARECDPKLFDAQYHLGATLWWTGDNARALEALAVAVRLQPDHAEARYYLGLSLKKRGDLLAAIDELETSVRLNGSIAASALQLGVALKDAGDAAGAIEQLRRAAALDPSSREARNSLGLALAQHAPGRLCAVAIGQPSGAATFGFRAARMSTASAGWTGESRRFFE